MPLEILNRQQMLNSTFVSLYLIFYLYKQNKLEMYILKVAMQIVELRDFISFFSPPYTYQYLEICPRGRLIYHM